MKLRKTLSVGLTEPRVTLWSEGFDSLLEMAASKSLTEWILGQGDWMFKRDGEMLRAMLLAGHPQSILLWRPEEQPSFEEGPHNILLAQDYALEEEFLFPSKLRVFRRYRSLRREIYYAWLVEHECDEVLAEVIAHSIPAKRLLSSSALHTDPKKPTWANARALAQGVVRFVEDDSLRDFLENYIWFGGKEL